MFVSPENRGHIYPPLCLPPVHTQTALVHHIVNKQLRHHWKAISHPPHPKPSNITEMTHLNISKLLPLAVFETLKSNFQHKATRQQKDACAGTESLYERITRIFPSTWLLWPQDNGIAYMRPYGWP
jgi:hypothetical protein